MALVIKSLDQTGTISPDVSQIERSLEKLKAELNHLHMVASDLHKRLSPILSPLVSGGGSDGDSNCSRSNSPVAEVISMATFDAESIRAILQDAIIRLEV